jgi:hypothetical protein
MTEGVTPTHICVFPANEKRRPGPNRAPKSALPFRVRIGAAEAQGPLGGLMGQFDDAVLPRWLAVSTFGLIVSAGAYLGSEAVLARMSRTRSVLNVSARVLLASVSGFGIGFGLLFAMTLTAGAAYWLLRAWKRRGV